jgi:hypothetical protein
MQQIICIFWGLGDEALSFPNVARGTKNKEILSGLKTYMDEKEFAMFVLPG